MFRYRFNDRPVAFTVECVLFAALMGLLGMPFTSAWAKSSKAHPRQRVSATPIAKADIDRPDADLLLIAVYKDLAANHLSRAQAKADALVQAYPNFRLGHLIRGDLLLMHTRPVTTFGAVAPGFDDKVKNLRDEAAVRLKSLIERPDPELVPRSILQLRQDQRHVLVVDAKRSRLYVYENQAGQMKFMADYYVSQGKLGTNKLKAGDQKTPIGVYYITNRLSGTRLPDFYGAGALPINYPNEWDRFNGRSGSGIWLHGTPSDSYSRPPLSSDGCVVLTNPDLHKLYASVEIGKTPVVISEHVEFVSKKRRDHDRNMAAKLVETWRRDVESRNPVRLVSNYSPQFKSEGGDKLAAWLARRRPFATNAKNVSFKLRDVSLFLYPGRDDLIVGSFTEDGENGKSRYRIHRRQYWAKEGAQWKIVSESAA
jgi:murein L,D-transpeptidase YafK